MNKIKKLISGISDEAKELAKRFPLTMMIVLILTLVLTYTIGLEEDSATLDKIILFLVTFGVGTYFTDNFFKEKKLKIVSYVGTAVISFIFTYILSIDSLSEDSSIRVLRFYATYMLSICALTIWKIIKNEKVSVKEYLVKTFRNLFNSTIIYGVLALGTTILLVIFVELILNGKYGDSLKYLHLWLFGIYYVPSVIYSISLINKNELNAFYKGLILKVLLPISLIAMLIIYAYIAKIFIQHTMPKNIIFRILAGVFIAVFPIYTMAEYYANDSKFLQRVSKFWPIAYCPFMFLELYSLGIRIKNYGITESRYLCMAFMVFQAIILFLCIYKNKEKLKDIFFAFILILIIGVISPINYRNATAWSQYKRLEVLENKEFEDFTNEEKNEISNIYRYLQQNDYEIPEYITDEDKSKIKDYYYSDDSSLNYYNQLEYVYYNNSEVKNVDISNYNTMSKYRWDGDSKDNKENIYVIEVNNEKVNIKEYIDEVIRQDEISSENSEEYIAQNSIIHTDYCDLYITQLQIRYNEIDSSAESFDIWGYVFK